jgi:hypothetical protein
MILINGKGPVRYIIGVELKAVYSMSCATCFDNMRPSSGRPV